MSSLEELKQKIDKTWQLLDLDKTKTEIKVLQMQMAEPNFWQDPDQARNVSKRHDNLSEEVKQWQDLRSEVDLLIDLQAEAEKEGLDGSIAREIEEKTIASEKKFSQLEFYVLLDGKYDKNDAIISIHAGTGGTEAQDWAEMLLRMILRYCEKKGFSTKILQESRGGEAGLKSVTFSVAGNYAFGFLKSEAGVHRLVRISPFDAEAMRHTSFALIEVVPEIKDFDEVKIDEKDLKIDVYRASGHGGQSVNTTDSAVRITHIPTNIVVTCQNERSQLQNKETALKILKSKLHQLYEQEKEEERAKLRGEYSSPEWGNQIRSYVLHPYHMVKDHRTEYETADTESVLNGELDDFVAKYLEWLKQDKSKK